MPLYLNSRATTIYAGSNEVQRDLIARSLAGA
jgi:alkylation response protein AidB-like acyl-CoA dehydrogenase